MDEWAKIFAQVGVPAGLLVGVLWYLKSALWPFIVNELTVTREHMEACNKAREESQREFLAALQRQDQLLSVHMKEIADKLSRCPVANGNQPMRRGKR